MMGGLAYMTGPPGRPLRAGASVNDIMGGMFAVIGIMGALMERARTGRGQRIRSALFENNAFLVSQHMAQFAVTGAAAAPMPARISSWGIYDVFDTADPSQIFIACVTDTQWRSFCEAFGSPISPPTPRSPPIRSASPRAIACCRDCATCSASSCATRSPASASGSAIGYAPIIRPDELFGDPQLQQPGAMIEVTLADGRIMPIPALPLEMDGERFGKRFDIPRAGEHSATIAAELGCTEDEIRALVEEGVLGVSDAAPPMAGKPAKSASA